MSDYPDNILWRAVLIVFALLAVVAAVFVAVYYATRITPEREADLKAQGAAAFDAKVEAAGGWDKWLAREIGVDARCSCVVIVNGQDARCPSVASADGQDARRPSREVR